MTLHDWIYSKYPPDSVINGRWGTLHIGVVLLCLAAAVLIALLRKKEKPRQWALPTLAMAIAVLEIARRVINLTNDQPISADYLAYVLLPRPWCAISCWLTMYTVFFGKKKFLYNFSAMNSLLCALVFFAYPSVGFNDRVILFENFYSITTHSLLLISSLSMMTLGFTDFRYEKNDIFKTLCLLVAVYIYATAEILLGIESDPLYFMPGNDVQAFLGVDHSLYLVIYVGFLILYFNAFYFATYRLSPRKKAQIVPAH